MSNYVKPQSPLYNEHNDTYIYPLTTVDQIIMPDGSRMDPENLGGNKVKLNYSVVGGLEEPQSPTENMIWVNTDTEITKVVFRNAEPNNPVEGMICIYTGSGSNVSFDRIVINGIGVDEVYPLSAKQYISGAWVDKIAKSYQGGKWVEWIIYLYNYNKQTIKWVASAEKMGTSGTAKAPTVTYNSDGSVKLILNVSSGTAGGVFRLEEPFDLTGYSLLAIETGDGIDDTIQGLTVYKDGTLWGPIYDQYSGQSLAYQELKPNGTFTLDVSGVNEPCRIGVGLYHGDQQIVTLKSLVIQ